MSTRSTILRGAAAGRAHDAVHQPLIRTVAAPAGAAAPTALEQAEAARQMAMQKGYEDGLERARLEVQAAMEDADKRVRRALAALGAAIESFETRETTSLAKVEDAIVAGALGIAQAVVERELSVATTPGVDALARAMKLAPERGDVIARLNPMDAETLSMEEVATSTRNIRVVADPSVEPGGCIVEVGETRIDAQLSSAFAHVKEALFGSNEPPAAYPFDAQDAAGRRVENSRTTASEAPNE